MIVVGYRKKRVVRTPEERAWFEYLDDVKDLHGIGYDMSEPKAWARLQKELAHLNGEELKAA